MRTRRAPTRPRGRDTPRAPIQECPNCGQDIRADAAFCKHCAFQLDEADATEFESAELTECPNCAEDLTPIPPDLRTVCPGCRIDLDDGTEPVEATPNERGAADATADTEEIALEEVDYLAEGYVRWLADAGIHTLEELAQADLDALAPKTDISNRRIREWIEEAPVEVAQPEPQPTRTVPAPTGRDELDAQATKIQRSPDELVLEVMGREMEVTDGSEVGCKGGTAMVEAGAPGEDAVSVHRKHFRVESDDERVRLTRYGETA